MRGQVGQRAGGVHLCSVPPVTVTADGVSGLACYLRGALLGANRVSGPRVYLPSEALVPQGPCQHVRLGLRKLLVDGGGKQFLVVVCAGGTCLCRGSVRRRRCGSTPGQ
jgi:hypothetical protein